MAGNENPERLDRYRALQDLLHQGASDRPQNRYTNKVKIGNWAEDRIIEKYQGDVLANIQPQFFEWDITGKVGSCEDYVRKKEYQEMMLEKLQNQPDPPRKGAEDACYKIDVPSTNACYKNIQKTDITSPASMLPRYKGTPYNELDEHHMNYVFDKCGEDKSNGMKFNFDRKNHHMYEGYEPAHKIPPVCQHKKEFFPVTINWGLGATHRKRLALIEEQNKHRWVTSYRIDFGPDTWWNFNLFDYHVPPQLPQQKPLAAYRRRELGACADQPLGPNDRMRPPRSKI